MDGDNLTKKDLPGEAPSRGAGTGPGPKPPFSKDGPADSITFDLYSDTSDLAIMVVQDEKIVFVNDTVLKFLSAPKGFLIGQPITRLLQPEEKDLVVDRHRRRTQGQEPLPSYSLRYRDQEGRVVLVEIKAIRIMFQGRPAVLCLFLDMAKRDLSREVVDAQRSLALTSTAKGREEDPLGASLKMAVRITNSMGGAVFIQNRSRKMEPAVSESLDQEALEQLTVVLNKTALKKILKTGRPHYPGEAAKNSQTTPAWAELDELTCLGAVLPLAHQGQTTACLALVTTTGRQLPDTGREALEATIPLLESIISRIIFEQASRKSKKRFQTLVETMPQGLGIYDFNGRFTYANQALCRMLGYSQRELLGSRAVEFMAPGHDDFLKEPETGRPGATEPYQAEWVTKGGERIFTLNRWQPASEEDGPADETFAVTIDVTAMKEAEEALAESEAKFRGAFDSAAVGMALVDPEGIYLEVNESFCRMLGYSAEELVGYNQSDFLYREDPDLPIPPRGWLPDLEEMPEAAPDTRFLRKDGKVAWAIQASSLLTDSQDQPLYYIQQYIDVSEQYLVTQALSATHEEYRRIFQSLPLPCLSWEQDEQGFQVRDFNLAMSEIFHTTAQASDNSGIEDFFKSRQDIINDLEYCTANRSFLQRDTTFDLGGSQGRRYIHLAHTFVPPNRVLMICKDETAHHQVLDELRESEEHLRSLMESSQEFCIFRLKIDPDPPHKRRVVFVSPSVREIVGTSDPMDIESWYANILPEDRELWKRAREKTLMIHGFSETIRIDHPRKGIRWLRVISRVVPGGAGRLAYSNGMISDVTDLKQAELALKEKEEELKAQTTSLTESNIALRVLLRNLQQDKETFQENIISNIKKQIVSGLDTLVKSGMTLPEEARLESIFESIDDVTSPFVKRLSADYIGLTKRELEVAKQVRAGLSTSQIAESLGISTNAVAVHRKNIRAKLGIKSRKVNLSVYLQKLSD